MLCAFANTESSLTDARRRGADPDSNSSYYPFGLDV